MPKSRRKTAARRSQAARKGWATRRRAARAAAARKGWRTRRRNAAKRRKARRASDLDVEYGGLEIEIAVDYEPN